MGNATDFLLNKTPTGTTAKNPAQRSILDELRSEEFAQVLTRILPKGWDKDRFIGVAEAAIITQHTLLRCNIRSLREAFLRAARLGLEPNTDAGHCFIHPASDGTSNAEFILGYRGMLTLALRSPNITSVEARTVYTNDEFWAQYGTGPDAGIIHIPTLEGDPGEPRCFYGIVRFATGGYYYLVASLDDINARRDESPSGAAGEGPWATNYEAMARKTVVRMMEPYLDLAPGDLIEGATGVEPDPDTVPEPLDTTASEGDTK